MTAADAFNGYSALAVHTLCAQTKARAYAAMAALVPLCRVVDKPGPDSALRADAHKSTGPIANASF